MIQSPPKVVDTHWNHKRKCKCISHRHTPTLWVKILKARKKTKEVVVKEEEEVEEEEQVNNILDKEATNIGRQSACSQFVLMKVSRKERDWIAIRLILSSLSSLSRKKTALLPSRPPKPHSHSVLPLFSRYPRPPNPLWNQKKTKLGSISVTSCCLPGHGGGINSFSLTCLLPRKRVALASGAG